MIDRQYCPKCNRPWSAHECDKKKGFVTHKEFETLWGYATETRGLARIAIAKAVTREEFEALKRDLAKEIDTRQRTQSYLAEKRQALEERLELLQKQTNVLPTMAHYEGLKILVHSIEDALDRLASAVLELTTGVKTEMMLRRALEQRLGRLRTACKSIRGYIAYHAHDAVSEEFIARLLDRLAAALEPPPEPAKDEVL